ncbi:hypothetical protein BKA81DRAFT_371176 [Phyllosticta paracitricarpa]|uniref:Uncharacterized protein n=1 Tax=Phyllosticta paracitricarpa TaxID=2016321 RepID=A0ABR1N0Y4_9PEZI
MFLLPLLSSSRSRILFSATSPALASHLHPLIFVASANQKRLANLFFLLLLLILLLLLLLLSSPIWHHVYVRAPHYNEC